MKVHEPKPATRTCYACGKQHPHAIHLAVGSVIRYFCSLDCLKPQNR